MTRALAALALTVFVLPVLVIGAALGALEADGAPAGSLGPMPATAEIPPERLALYQEAGAAFSVPWEILAAVGKVECDHGRDLACLVPNVAGAAGPMQFLPSTWARYASASGSPAPSIYHPRDAVHAAGAKLAADGVGRDPWAAVRSYNPSDAYVASVLAFALAYGWQPTHEGLLARAALSHPRLRLSPGAGGDVRRGVVDERLLAVLLVGGTRHDLGSIGPLVSGHSDCVGGGARRSRPDCSLSNHIFGRAADVFSVDGKAVSVRNQAARALLDEILALPAAIRPDEIGVPFPDYDPLPGVFSNAAHRDHLHLGFETDPVPEPPPPAIAPTTAPLTPRAPR